MPIDEPSAFDFWREMVLPEHVVHIYENDGAFLDILQGFIQSGLQAGDGVIAIVTPVHLHAIEVRLAEHGVELGALRSQDRYIAVDAEELLARFMVSGWPDGERFTRAVSDLSRVPAAEGERAGIRRNGRLTLGARGSGCHRSFGASVERFLPHANTLAPVRIPAARLHAARLRIDH